MRVTYFFRKARQGAYSIENLFSIIQEKLQHNIEIENQYLSYHSTGIKNRFLLLREAAQKQGAINHITGDINFIALALPKVKTVLTIHDIESLERHRGLSDFLLNLFWLKLPVENVGKITVISEHTRKKLLNKIKLDPEKVVVIPNPVSDIYLYTPKPFLNVKPSLLQVGTKYNKNLENLIPALDGIICKLTIIGKLSENQLRLLHKHNIDFINKVGLSNEELLQEYINTDIVTFISSFEGFGLPIIEANAVGRVVITSNRGAMTEVASNAALLVDPRQVEDIRMGILNLISNDQLRERLIKNGLENVKKYRSDVIASKYLTLYEQI